MRVGLQSLLLTAIQLIQTAKGTEICFNKAKRLANISFYFLAMKFVLICLGRWTKLSS